jgi:predicted ATPase
MLKAVQLHGIGPVEELSARFGERLNVITGDNGLGKSFLLDVSFWCLTGSWPGDRMAIPKESRKTPSISYTVASKTKDAQRKSEFDRHWQVWPQQRGRRPVPGLVIYAAVDGGFSVWDPMRNIRKSDRRADSPDYADDMPRAFNFQPEGSGEDDEYGRRRLRRDVANGLEDDGRVLCNGLIADWAEWFNRGPNTHPLNPFGFLTTIVAQLSHPSEPIECVEPQKVFVDDSRRFPMLKMPYGDLVPYPQWSAGMKRIINLCYLIVWAWVEHIQAARLRGQAETDRIILIVDEVEVHLHPKWQRTILPALLKLTDALSHRVPVQVLTASHSPLVLASIEPHFASETDRFFWFDFDEKSRKVTFRDMKWVVYGDVVGWLTSPIFGLKQARSKEAEDAIGAAEAFMRGESNLLPQDLRTKNQIHTRLRKTLSGLDPFWPRWIVEAHP